MAKHCKIKVMSENEVSQRIVHACYIIHSKLGPGLFESVYEEILSFELKRVGLKIERQKVIPVYQELRDAI